jgi:hypothetical protein
MIKKGLLLSLLVVAVVCVAVPAGARAPIVESLPDIIIGDAGDTSGGNSLLRYLNIIEIGTPGWITTQNGMGTANLSVYYASYSDNIDQDGSTVVKDSNTTDVIEPLTGAERSLLTGGSHVAPPTAKRIDLGGSGVGFTWLSLFNSLVSSGTLNAYDLDPAVNGVAPVDFPAGFDDVSTLTIYALEVDGATRLLGSATSLVVSEAGVADSAGDSDTNLLDQNGADLLGLWVETPGLAATEDFDIISVMAVPDGLGWNPLPNNNSRVVFGQWESGDGTNPATIISADEGTVGAGNILHLTATLGSNAATALQSTGYRLYYAAGAYQHFGGATVFTDPARGASVLTPATGADFDLHLYWAVPYDLTEYADGELLSDFGSVTGGAYADARDYRILFGMIDHEAADADAVWMSNLKVDVIARPAGRIPHIAWGGEGVPFTDTTQGWQETDKVPTIAGVTWPIGNVSFSPAGTWFDIGPGIADVGYQEAAPRPAAFGVGVSWTASKLVRFRAHLTSVTNVEQSPMFRILGLIWRGGIPMNISWQDELGPNVFAKPTMELLGGVTTGTPAVPKGGAGSIVEVYIYTHSGGPANALLAPSMDVYNANTFAEETGWAPANGSLRLSSFSVEDDI